MALEFRSLSFTPVSLHPLLMEARSGPPEVSCIMVYLSPPSVGIPRSSLSTGPEVPSLQVDQEPMNETPTTVRIGTERKPTKNFFKSGLNEHLLCKHFMDLEDLWSPPSDRKVMVSTK